MVANNRLFFYFNRMFYPKHTVEIKKDTVQNSFFTCYKNDSYLLFLIFHSFGNTKEVFFRINSLLSCFFLSGFSLFIAVCERWKRYIWGRLLDVMSLIFYISIFLLGLNESFFLLSNGWMNENAVFVFSVAMYVYKPLLAVRNIILTFW